MNFHNSVEDFDRGYEVYSSWEEKYGKLGANTD